jgi:16S rRNA (uracil1498-N3)-methyltransferase
VNPALRHSAAHVFVDQLVAPVLAADDLHHLSRVLRLRDGEAVSLSDGLGGWRMGEWRAGVVVPVGEIHREVAPRSCVVASAIPKGDRADWMVQKLTELGATELIFLHCARSVVRWEGDRGAKQLARMTRISREAAVQSRRVWLPTLRGPVPFADVVAIPGSVVLDPDGPEALSRTAGKVLVIGPEGGFQSDEIAAAALRCRLGDTILRVETAAIAAVSVMLTGD